MYYFGDGVAEDFAAALGLYRKAADQGHALAQFNLGVIYYSGEGVARDVPAAVDLFRSAAEQGNAGAQFNLALMYFNADGVPRDLVQAYVWAELAVNFGEANAPAFRRTLENAMTRAQVGEALRISRERMEAMQ